MIINISREGGIIQGWRFKHIWTINNIHQLRVSPRQNVAVRWWGKTHPVLVNANNKTSPSSFVINLPKMYGLCQPAHLKTSSMFYWNEYEVQVQVDKHAKHSYYFTNTARIWRICSTFYIRHHRSQMAMSPHSSYTRYFCFILKRKRLILHRIYKNAQKLYF